MKALVDAYEAAGGEFGVVQVTEQAIMDATILANRHGHIVCTQGGECLAGLLKAREEGRVAAGEKAVLDSTAHALKFAGFQNMYFTDTFPPEYGVAPDASLANRPSLVVDAAEKTRLSAEEFTRPPQRLSPSAWNLPENDYCLDRAVSKREKSRCRESLAARGNKSRKAFRGFSKHLTPPVRTLRQG